MGKQRMVRGQQGDVPILQRSETKEGLFPLTFSAYAEELLHGPGRAGRSGRPPGAHAQAGVSPPPNGPEPSRSSVLVGEQRGRTGRTRPWAGGGETSGPAPRVAPRVAATLMPGSWAAVRPLENGVGKLGWRKAKLRGLTQHLPPSGVASVLGKLLKWGEWRKHRRGSQRCEVVPRARHR